MQMAGLTWELLVSTLQGKQGKRGRGGRESCSVTGEVLLSWASDPGGALCRFRPAAQGPSRVPLRQPAPALLAVFRLWLLVSHRQAAKRHRASYVLKQIKLNQLIPSECPTLWVLLV